MLCPCIACFALLAFRPFARPRADATGHARSPQYPQNTDWSGAAGFCYFYDEYRIAPNSKPGRVILADGIEMCTQYGVEPPNHYDGANVL
jgi:hypothetical protein